MVISLFKNKAFTKVRVSIEWNYKTTSNLFKILRNKEKLKILGSRNTSKLYTVCTILKNCHVALYGCQSLNYFSLNLPYNTLEKYMQMPGY